MPMMGKSKSGGMKTSPRPKANPKRVPGMTKSPRPKANPKRKK